MQLILKKLSNPCMVDTIHTSSIYRNRTCKRKGTASSTIQIFVIRGNEYFTTNILKMLSISNPTYFAYDLKRDCCYTHYFGINLIRNNLGREFYEKLLHGNDNEEGRQYLEDCKATLKRYANWMKKNE